jgi:hypothetical protein
MHCAIERKAGAAPGASCGIDGLPAQRGFRVQASQLREGLEFGPARSGRPTWLPMRFVPAASRSSSFSTAVTSSALSPSSSTLMLTRVASGDTGT